MSRKIGSCAFSRGSVSSAQGKASSRAALVTSAVEREMRRQAAETDATILRERGAADDLDALVDWTMHNVEVAG